MPLKRMDEVVAGLLAAADKYLLEKLKKACGDHLVSKISLSNRVQLLSLGKNDPAYYLRKEAVDYICRFPTEVMATDKWKKANEEKTEWIVNIKDIVLESVVLQLKGSK